MPIACHEDPSLPLGPKEETGVESATWQVRRTADADHIARVDAKNVMLLDGLPQPTTAQILVQ
jgi:hypothetical protein